MTLQTNIKHRAYLNEVGDDLKARLNEGLEYIGWDKYINRNSKVLVKPNFTFPEYREGVTTNPEVLRCLLELLGSKGAKVTVGESDGGNHSFKAEDAFIGHNMYQICKDTGTGLVNLSALPAETVEASVLHKRVRVQLPKLLLEDTDCFISVPVLKVHVMTTVSLSLKNSWGCNPDTMRSLQHQNLAYKLALIARSIKPRIVVIDGTYALDKHGPMYGEPVRMNLILVADNAVAADAMGATIMGFSPEAIAHLMVAEKAGLGSTSLDRLEMNQDWQQYQRQFYLGKTLIDRVSTLLFNSDVIARLVMQSPMTSAIYKIAGMFRTSDEREIASQIGKRRTLGLY